MFLTGRLHGRFCRGNTSWVLIRPVDKHISSVSEVRKSCRMGAGHPFVKRVSFVFRPAHRILSTNIRRQLYCKGGCSFEQRTPADRTPPSDLFPSKNTLCKTNGTLDSKVFSLRHFEDRGQLRVDYLWLLGSFNIGSVKLG